MWLRQFLRRHAQVRPPHPCTRRCSHMCGGVLADIPFPPIARTLGWDDNPKLSANKPQNYRWHISVCGIWFSVICSTVPLCLICSRLVPAHDGRGERAPTGAPDQPPGQRALHASSSRSCFRSTVYSLPQLKRAALDHVLTCAQPGGRRGRPKTKCGECAVCRNSKSKKKCGPRTSPPNPKMVSPRSKVSCFAVVSRSLSLSRIWSTPPAPPPRRSLPHCALILLIRPNAPLLQVHRGGSARAGAAEAAQGGSAVSGLAWPRILAAKARRNRHGFAVHCRAVQRQPQAQVVPQGVVPARQSRRRDVRRSPVRVWQGERLLQHNPHLLP